MYNIIPKSKEWLIVDYVVNVIGTTLPGFYIFRGERIYDDYIQLCKLRICMVMQSKAWMTTSLFKEFLFFFKRSILSGISLTNRHLFILHGHRSHVMFEAIEQINFFGLDMITLPSHTFHALQPLDAACFKPFKITFKKERDISIVKRNYTKLDKITLAGWVDKALDLSFTRKNVMLAFKCIGIWPFNPRAMDSKIDLNVSYTLQNLAKEEEESK